MPSETPAVTCIKPKRAQRLQADPMPVVPFRKTSSSHQASKGRGRREYGEGHVNQGKPRGDQRNGEAVRPGIASYLEEGAETAVKRLVGR